ncbi:SMI1/KNR4 family protein [Gottfriedia acidiceleris]|uniref:SMI1/KNR4 family protein n=1 Tax=Gottfriedia acidiceleris TaxID=371036 RepID=UPI00101BBA32|nr:SMI1/KNR4 family protein [Gottfriedia acidiceleris]
MSWSNYEKALALLEENKVNCDYIGECSDLLIEKAEIALGLKFPNIYRHFIRKYGAGVFATWDILGITNENIYESYNPDYPDAIKFTLLKRKENNLPKNFISIIDYDYDILYCLDFNKLNDKSEPAVVNFNIGEEFGEQELIAEDFGDFLLDIIQAEIEALKLSPIKIIYDVETLKGTCYVEIKPGKDTGRHWNKDSIYFTDETFTYLTRAIEKEFKDYSNWGLWGVCEIDKSTWSLILKQLENVKLFLKDDPKVEEIKTMVGFLWEDTESKFQENINQNIINLINLISEFQLWISDQCKKHEFITILGI